METVLRRPFTRLSLSRQFLLVSAGILACAMAVIGTGIGRQIETSAVNRAAAIAAVYVESILVAEIADWPVAGALDPATRAALDRLFVDGPLRRKVVRVKLWRSDGTVLYSSDSSQVGGRFPVDAQLAAAFGGFVQAGISDLSDPDNHSEREHGPRLIEVYVPVRGGAQEEVTAVAEFYHSMENLDRDIRAARQRSWLLVAVAAVGAYLLMLGMVRRANRTILGQQQDLRRQLHQLRSALSENERMREQLHEAAARTTTLNEQLLLRVAADLHDGPAQDVALALLRIESLGERCGGCGPAEPGGCGDFRTTRDALHSAIEELRAIASGLRLPGFEHLSLAATVQRAVHDFERKSGISVQVEIDEAPVEVPLAVKITAYRLVQESLVNGWRHARGHAQRVRMSHAGGLVEIEVADDGPGFDVGATALKARLGIAFMRERVRLLGGSFEIESAHGQGTRILARLPLSPEQAPHG